LQFVLSESPNAPVVAARSKARLGRLRGQVVDENGARMANIGIEFAPGNLRRTTDTSGAFEFDSLMPGRYTLTARAIGRVAASQAVDVVNEEVPSVFIRMGGAQRLDTVVTIDANKSRDRRDYERRRAAHIGYALDGDQLAVRADSYSALTTFAGVQLTRQGFGVKVRMRSSRCTPTTFLDGMKVDIELASSVPINQLRAIELFSRGSDAPPEFHNFASNCGLILFWSTKHK